MTREASQPEPGRKPRLGDPAAREPAGGQPGRERLELELERGSDPISGELTDGGGLRWHFAGWLQLMSILERAKAPETRETGERR
jgi:hypothetical protein